MRTLIGLALFVIGTPIAMGVTIYLFWWAVKDIPGRGSLAAAPLMSLTFLIAGVGSLMFCIIAYGKYSAWDQAIDEKECIEMREALRITNPVIACYPGTAYMHIAWMEEGFR